MLDYLIKTVLGALARDEARAGWRKVKGAAKKNRPPR